MEPTRAFLDKFSNDRQFFLSLPFLWSVEMPGSESLNSAINTANNKLLSQETWRATSEVGTSEVGILAARQVTIPGENAQFVETGQDNRGAFLPGYGVQQRESFLTRTLSINFIETINDMVHTIFTPWSIAISVDGLTNFDLKTDIIVKQYDNQLQLRKGYRFIEAFPTNVEGFTVTQDPDAAFTEKTVTFSFTDYVPDYGHGGF